METFNHKLNDPWVGGNIEQIKRHADPTHTWLQLLENSTHINWLVTLNKNWHIVPEKLEQYVNNNRIIVNMSADPFRGWEETIVEELKNYTDNFVVLSSDVKYFQSPKDNICFLPFWYLNQKYCYAPIQYIDKPRNYKVSSLNNQARYHRIENFIKLRKKPYFDQLLFGMIYRYDKQLVRRQTQTAFYNRNIIAEFESLIPATITPFKDDACKITLPAHDDSCVNLVTETSIYDGTIFVSEKSCKPFMSGQLGVWLSNPGTVNFLRSVGFDMFDDVFDNHKYDCEVDLNLRIDQLHEVIDRLMTLDVNRIFQDTTERRQANIDHFYSSELETVLTRQCQGYSAIINT